MAKLGVVLSLFVAAIDLIERYKERIPFDYRCFTNVVKATVNP